LIAEQLSSGQDKAATFCDLPPNSCSQEVTARSKWYLAADAESLSIFDGLAEPNPASYEGFVECHKKRGGPPLAPGFLELETGPAASKIVGAPE
jgi:hypothetical protein